MPQTLVMTGQVPDGGTQVLNFSGQTPGHAFRLTSFKILTPSVYRFSPVKVLNSNGIKLLGSQPFKYHMFSLM